MTVLGPPTAVCSQCLRKVGPGLPGHAPDCPVNPEGRPWWQRTLAALDFETTSPDPREARMVSYALVYVYPNGTVWEEKTLTGIVDPGVEVPEQAAAIHGLTTERVRREGGDPVVAIQGILAHLAGLEMTGAPLVIFNAPFDWTLLVCEARRHLIDPTGDWEFPVVNIVDPLVIDRKVDKYRKGKRTLERAVEVYAPDHQLDAHDARADCVASTHVVRALASKHPTVGQLEPAELHAVQAGWYDAWVQDFNAYRAKKGQDPIPDRGWPLAL